MFEKNNQFSFRGWTWRASRMSGWRINNSSQYIGSVLGSLPCQPSDYLHDSWHYSAFCCCDTIPKALTGRFYFASYFQFMAGWFQCFVGLRQNRKSYREHVTEQSRSIHDNPKGKPERRKRMAFQGIFQGYSLNDQLLQSNVQLLK